MYYFKVCPKCHKEFIDLDRHLKICNEGEENGSRGDNDRGNTH
jgi:hypothetical protein